MIIANLTMINLSNKAHITTMPFLLCPKFINRTKQVANNPKSTTTPRSERSSKKTSYNIKLNDKVFDVVNESCLL